MSFSADDLAYLYKELLIDHSRSPLNKREIAGPDHQADGFNPLCGDQVRIYVAMDGDNIVDAAFTGKGCAICTASASMMTEAIKSQPREKVVAWFEKFHHMLTNLDGDIDQDAIDLPEELIALGGVRRFPIRVKCATLPWHTLKAALDGEQEAASTE